MKRKFKLLSIMSALLMGVTMTFTACGKNSVEEHDHVWNNGEVTTEATCHSEGVKTYTCTVDGCEQTKTEPVAMIAHTWNGGEVTKEATCKEEGVKTYTCTVEGCGKKKEEAVEKTDHKWNGGEVTKIPDFYTKGVKTYTCQNCDAQTTESVEARADFAEQYISKADGKSNWLYGYTESFDAETNEAEFKDATLTDGVWKADGVEIGKGYIYSEKHAIIAYTFTEEVPEQVQSELSVSFKGENSDTVLKAYLLITDGEFEVQGREALNTEGKKDWDYKTENPVDIAQGYTFWLVFEKAGTGKAGGNLSITFTAPCVHVWNSTGSVQEPATCMAEGVMEYSCINCDATTTGPIEMVDHEYVSQVTKEATDNEEGIITYSCKYECGNHYIKYIPKLVFDKANFNEDFSLDDDIYWHYGYTNNFNFDNNTFTFTQANPDTDTGAWKDNGGGIEIKSDWFKNETDGANAVVSYLMPQTREISVYINFTGTSVDETRISARLHILKPDGTVQSCEFISDGQKSSSWTYRTTVSVERESVISVIFFNEPDGGYYHGHFELLLAPSDCAHENTVKVEGYDATCMEKGLTDGVRCLDCGKMITEQTEIAVDETAHKWGAWQTSKPASCVAEGEEERFCEYNHDHRDWKETDIDPDGHKVDESAINITEPPTFEKEGTATTGECLNNCGHYSGGKVTLPKLDDEGYVVENNTATCTDDGEGDYTITIGTITVGPFKAETKALGHDYEEEWDCDGQNHWHNCTRCDSKDGTDAHSWKVFTKSTLTSGNKICAVCGKNAEDATEKSARSSTTFAGDFELNDNGEFNGWEVGVVDFIWSAENFNFTKITAKNEEGDAYHDNTKGWKVIKGDWMASNEMMGFAYHFYDTAYVNFNFVLNGADNSKFSVRWALKDKYGNIKTNNGKASWGGDGKDITVSKDITVEDGYVLYILVNKEGDNDQCNFNITLTKYERVADFGKDFAGVLAGENTAWKVGYASYDFPTETFDFNEVTDKTGDAFKIDDPFMEVKGDWMASNTMTTLAYTFGEAGSIRFNFAAYCRGNGEFAIRWAVKDSAGNIKTNNGKASWGGDGFGVTVSEIIDIAEGDTLYILIDYKWANEGEPERNTEKDFTFAIAKNDN